MTRDEAIALRPSSKAGYWTVLTITALTALLGVCGIIFLKHFSTLESVVTLFFILAHLLFGTQAALRLFAPEIPARFALSLSENAKRILHRSRVTLRFLGMGLAFVGLFSHKYRYFGVLGWTLYGTAPFLSDLYGQPLHSPPAGKIGPFNTSTGPATQWGPVHSDHWANR